MTARFAKLTGILCLLVATGVLYGQDSTKQSTTKESKGKMDSGNEVIVIKTSMGTIKAELLSDKAPVSVKNFLSYVDEKYYDGTVFHRVIKNFMIQGGGFSNADPIKQKKTKAPIVNESDNGVSNSRGTFAMARTNDPNSATSQFFINVVDNKFLDKGASGAGYAVFGKVTEGMDVVDKIRNVATGNLPAIALNGEQPVQTTFQDVPVTKVVVESIRRLHPKP